MPRTATRFSGPALVTNAAATKLTLTAVQLAIIRHIHVQNPSVSAVLFTMSIGADAAGTRIYDAYSIAAGAVLDAFCYYVVNPSEIVQAFAGTNNIVTLTIDGDLYTLG